MPINDVLALKATRRDAIANLKCFLSLGHHRPNFYGYIYIHYAAPPYSARINAIYFLPFDNIWLGSVSVCNAWEARRRILQRMGENSDPILRRLWTNVQEIFRWCRKPHVISNALIRLSVSLCIHKIFAIMSQNRRKTEQMQEFFGPQFFYEGRFQIFYSIMLRRLTASYLAKFGWVPFAHLRLRMESWQWSRMQNLWWLGKNRRRFWNRLWTKLHDILAQRRRPLVVNVVMPGKT